MLLNDNLVKECTSSARKGGHEMKMVMIGIAGVLFLSFAVICVFILAIM